MRYFRLVHTSPAFRISCTRTAYSSASHDQSVSTENEIILITLRIIQAITAAPKNNSLKEYHTMRITAIFVESTVKVANEEYKMIKLVAQNTYNLHKKLS